MRQPLPSGKPERVFSFDEPCGVASVSWSRDGKQGLVFAPSYGPDRGLRVWRVDFLKRTGTLVDLSGLPVPKTPSKEDVPTISKMSFDPQGRLVALVHYSPVLQPRSPEPDGKLFISFEGQRYPVDDGRADTSLVMAYRLEAGTWKRVELKPSTSGVFEPLETARTLQPVVSQSGVDGFRGKGSSSEGSRPEAAERRLPGQERGTGRRQVAAAVHLGRSALLPRGAAGRWLYGLCPRAVGSGRQAAAGGGRA